jgi:MHS family shikimate/dehydroshikimate transporter-like MFS transporter
MSYSKSDLIKVVIAASFGSIMEWFDYFIAATAAALVFPKVFFTSFPPEVSLALSIASFGIAYIIRPIGGIIFGQIGDKLGRKSTLVSTLIMIGGGTLALGLLPPYSSIGFIAVILVFVFRLIVGLGIGGEFGGANSWVIEFASNSKWRSFITSWIQSSANLGVVFGSIIFNLVEGLPQEEFLNWGWRVIFIFGSIAVAIGAIIRYKLSESPLFRDLINRKEIAGNPAIEALKKFGKSIILLSVIEAVPPILSSGLITPYSILFLTSHNISPMIATDAVAIGSIFAALGSVFGGYLGDKIGRKKTLIIGLILTMIAIIPFFPLLGTSIIPIIFLAQILLGFTNGISYGVEGAVFTEVYPTKYRYSASGITYQLGAFEAGMLSTFLISTLVAYSGGVTRAWPYNTAIALAVTFLALFSSIFTVKETKDEKLLLS